MLPITNIQCRDLLMCLFFTASFISPEKGRKMLPTPVGTASGTSLLGPSLLDGNSRDSFVSRSLADVAEVCDQRAVSALLPSVVRWSCMSSIVQSWFVVLGGHVCLVGLLCFDLVGVPFVEQETKILKMRERSTLM